MATYVATQSDNGRTYTLTAATNDVVRIELEEGGFVGYYWEVQDAPDPSVINFTDQGTTYSGSLGTHVWTNEAIATGTTSVTLKRNDGTLYTLNFVVV